jgi:hypothetical protein
MNKEIIILMFSLVYLTGFSQSDRKNELKIECFSPIMTPSMGPYFNDEWILTANSNYSRKYHSIGFAASYSRCVKNVKLGYRFGFVTRKIQEINNDKYGSSNQFYEHEQFNYKQNQFLNSIFLSREEHIKSLHIQVTFEIPFIYYGVAKNIYLRNDFDIDPLTNQPGLQIAEIIYETTASSGFATGLGMSIGLGYSFTKKMTVGIDLSDYLLYTHFNGPTKTHGVESGFEYDGSTNPPWISNTYDSENKINFSQWGFSRISPRLFYAFKF